MAKIKLRPTGGLNFDVDENNLPEGDYSSANNIVFETGSTGGAGAIRMMESISSSGLTYSGTLKATCQDPSGQIYALVRTDSTTATIYRINNTQTAIVSILTYSHTVTSDFTPDIVIVGDMLVWNYYGTGTVLSFALKRYTGTSTNYSIDNLLLQKKTPNNVLTIKKNLTVGAGKQILEAEDFQFASRYLYDSGEYSVLSNYSQMFKGEKNTSSYSISYNYSGTPDLVTSIETFVRSGNAGTWRRIDTRLKGDTTELSWIGQMYDTLDSVTAAKPFDAVPTMARHIEVAKNRIFLANIQDDYEVTPANRDISISIVSGNGYPLPSGSNKMYGLSSVNATSSETTYDGSEYAKPFSNNSTYAIGWAYYDAAMKTRGVEGFTRFSTGTFGYPMIPDVQLTTGGTYSKPSWAKYIQLLYTKNLSKSYIFEGYASNVFFEIKKEVTDSTTNVTTTEINFSQNVTTADLKNKGIRLVVDLMGMARAAKTYVWQSGDKINIRVVNNGVGSILNLDILEVRDNFVFCTYNGAEITIAATSLDIPDPANFYFEIYSPRQEQEEESLLFYEYGNLVDISSGFTGATFTGGATFANKKIIGDMVFTKIDLPTYKDSPFLYTAEKTTPLDANTVLNRTTTATGALTGSSMMQSSSGGVSGSVYKATTLSRSMSFISLTTNEDSATIPSTGTAIKLTGFYDGGRQTAGVSKITVNLNYSYTETLTIPSGTPPVGYEYTGMFNWSLIAQVYRTPYDNINNKKLAAVPFGQKFNVGTGSRGSYGTQTPTWTANFTLDLNKIGQDIQANDEFWIEFSFDFSASGDYSAASLQISGMSSTFTLYGNRTTPRIKTSYNPSTDINTTKSTFIVRSISNTTIDQQWNTSSGKPSVSAKDPVTLIRTNAIRYSGNFVYGTKINNVNSFFALDSNEVPIENGAINSLQNVIRLQGNGSMILALCERESCYIFLGEQELAQGNNASIRSLTSNFIGTIRNMGGNYGLKDKESVYNYKGNVWWWDDYNKKVVKYTSEGIQLPSNQGAKSYFLAKSGKAKIAYDPYYNMMFITIGSDTKSLGYSDSLQRWISNYDFVQDLAEAYGDKMILFKNGTVYKSLQSGYNSFFNTLYDGSIKFVINSQLPVLLNNVSIQHNCSVVDYSQSNNVKATLLRLDIDNDNGQVTNIQEPLFLIEDNRLYAHVMRDINSSGGIVNGDYMVGYISKILLTLKDKTQAMRIVSLDVDVEPVSGHS